MTEIRFERPFFTLSPEIGAGGAGASGCYGRFDVPAAVLSCTWRIPAMYLGGGFRRSWPRLAAAPRACGPRASPSCTWAPLLALPGTPRWRPWSAEGRPASGAKDGCRCRRLPARTWRATARQVPGRRGNVPGLLAGHAPCGSRRTPAHPVCAGTARRSLLAGTAGRLRGAGKGEGSAKRADRSARFANQPPFHSTS